MEITPEGLALIMRCEGFRADAYRDSAGVWTIGYGHTSMADEPEVHPGLQVTEDEAAAILRRDVQVLAAGVRYLIQKP